MITQDTQTNINKNNTGCHASNATNQEKMIDNGKYQDPLFKTF